MELLDIVDENNKLTGIAEERDIVHEKNLWHRHVSGWIMNEEGKVLLQRRAKNKSHNPNKWAKTGGHVDAGETVKEAITREIKEEIGIRVPNEKVEIVKINKSLNSDNKFFTYNFIIIVNYKIEEYILQKEEVSEVKYYTIEELEKIKKDNDKDYVFSNWNENDFYSEIAELKEKRKELKKVHENL